MKKKNNVKVNTKKQRQTKTTKYSNIKINALWYLATVIEWIIVPLYLASMGYEFDISLYEKLREWENVETLYYILASLDIALFGYFVIFYRKKDQLKPMGISVFCCLTQIVLLISKVKW